MNATAALNHYHKTGVHSGAMSASPHRLIAMLLNGALDKINIAKGYIAHGVVAGKGENIGCAISIVDGLRASLNKEEGGQLAENLDALYDYMGRRLLEANLESDVGKLEEVAALLNQIKSAWDAIEPMKMSVQDTAAERRDVSFSV
jgi:flagellar protein FliS